MKKISVIIVLMLFSGFTIAQDIIINFSGTGASTEVTTAEVVNMSNCTSIEVPSGWFLNLTTGTIFLPYNNDASLSDLTVSGSTVNDFAPTTLTYDVELPYGTTDVPVVEAAPTDENATYEITDATSLPGSTTILVTAEDGVSEQTYTINFSVITGIADNFLQANLIKSYPNPFNSSTTIEFYVNQNDNVQITVCDIAGKMIAQNYQSITRGIHSYEFTASSKGMYFINVSGSNFVYSTKVMCISDISQGSELVYKEQISNTLTEKSFFNDNTEVILQTEEDGKSKDFSFTEGDILKIKGISGDYIYATVIIVEPTVSETYTFNFVECTDGDGNGYAVVEIGDQTWMAESVRTSKYSNGDAIPLIEDYTEWGDLGDNNTDKGYCFYENDADTYAEKYGALYTWAAAVNGETSGVDVQGVCPIGWHVPNRLEFEDLIDEVSSALGSKIRAVCDSDWWPSSETETTNETGLSVYPSGFRTGAENGAFIYGGTGQNNGLSAYLWSSVLATESALSWRYGVDYYSDDFGITDSFKSHGFSVRCVKD